MEDYRIHAITVSKNYSKILKICLTENLRYLDKWYIVTQEDDLDTINLISEVNDPKIELVFYPLDTSKTLPSHEKSLLVEEEDLKLSTPDYLEPPDGVKRTPTQQKYYDKLVKNGVTFDKGGAIRQVQKNMLKNQLYTKNELILMLDSDIVLPSNFLETLNDIKFEKDTIYVCQRKNYLFYSDFQNRGGIIDKNSLVGAGYFQLYLCDHTKLCKRTYTAGWVDWEFKNQFKKIVQLNKLVVSHLGETDMNWSGKKSETFLHDEDIQEFCKSNEIPISDNNELTKRSIINSIRATRLNELERKKGLPNFILMGTLNTNLQDVMRILCTSPNVSFFQQTHPNASFFGNQYQRHELWNKKFDYYLNSFPKITNHNWFDLIEFDLNNIRTTNLIKKRFNIVFNEKIKVWREFRSPHIILCVKNPILRALSQYQYYLNNFPASFNWDWEYPTKSFEKNIFTKNGMLEDSTFLRNSIYIQIIDWLTKEMGIPLRQIIFLDVSANVKRVCKNLQNILEIKLDYNQADFEEDLPKINAETKKSLTNYFYDKNILLKKYSGINYNE